MVFSRKKNYSFLTLIILHLPNIFQFAVVIDRKYNKNADTGMFELVYKQNIPPAQPYMGQNLIVRGTKLETGWRANRVDKKRQKNRKISIASVVPASKIFRVGTHPTRKQVKPRDCCRSKKENIREARRTDNKENLKTNSEWRLQQCKQSENIGQQLVNFSSNDMVGVKFEPEKSTVFNQFPFVNDKTSKKPISPSSLSKQFNGYEVFPKIT